MNQRTDQGEQLAVAVVKVLDAFETWDQIQFLRNARAEWLTYLSVLEELTEISLSISLDFYKER